MSGTPQLRGLPPPVRYFPVSPRGYSVAPALRPLPKTADKPQEQVFQIDAEWPDYRANILRCRREGFELYCGRSRLPEEVEQAAIAFIARRLASEHAGRFRLTKSRAGFELQCGLSSETIFFGSDWSLRSADTDQVKPAYRDGLDALMSQTQEDLAIVCRDASADWLAYCHVCTPSNWSPAARLGENWETIHAPVPGMEESRRVAGKMVEAMVVRGPFERFVWSVQGDARLNRHPSLLTPEDRRAFSLDARQPFALRVERQVIWGLPAVEASLFVIRALFVQAAELDEGERRLLAAAIEGMPAESLGYKALRDDASALIAWLRRSPETGSTGR